MSKVKLGAVTDSCLGKMLDAEKNKGEYEPYLANVNVRWGSFDLSNLSLMKFESHEQERYGIKAGDLIMCEGGEPGRCAIWHDEIPNMKIQKALHRIRPREGLDIQYLFYWFLLAGRNGWLNKYFTETTIKHLPGDSLKDVEIDLPDIKTQEGIGNVLSTIDDLARHNQATILVLENMAKTLYDYWFTQFDFPNAEGKPYRASGGEMVWNDQLKREIPKGWSVGPLSDVISSINTGLNPRDNFKLGNGDIQYITVKNLTTSGTLDFSGCDTVDEEARAIIHNRSDISVGDILFASIAPLGRCYLIQSEPDNWDINESVFSIRPDYERTSSEYLYMFFMSDVFIKGATSSSTGSIFKGIRINTLLDMLAIVPPKEVADAFSDAVKPFLKMKEQIINENTELTHLRDWLLPMLMNGQATVE